MDESIPLPSPGEVARVMKDPGLPIPSPSPVAAKLLTVSADERRSARDLARIVESDPGISAALLKMVNSAAFGAATRKNVTSLKDVVVILGFSRVRLLALAVALAGEEGTKVRTNPGFHMGTFWRHALATASLARQVARKSGVADPEAAYVAGLLHDLGKLTLGCHGRSSYEGLRVRLEFPPQSPPEAEREWIGLGHDDLGAFLGESWGLPEDLNRVIQYHHRSLIKAALTGDQKALTAVTALADFLAWGQGMGSIDQSAPPVLQPGVTDIVDPAGLDVPGLLQVMDREVQETAAFFGYAFPDPTRMRVDLTRTALHLATLNAKALKAPAAATALPTVEPPKAVLPVESLLAPHRSLESKKIIRHTLEALGKDFGFKRIHFFRIERAKRILVREMVMEKGLGIIKLDPTEIPLRSEAGAFLQCVRTRLPQLFPGGTTDCGRWISAPLGLLPVPLENRVMGLIGVEIDDGAAAMDGLEALRPVMTELGRALGKAKTVGRLNRRANVDGLTGLMNRPSIERFLQRAYDHLAPGDPSLFTVMMDVDFFKAFNDQHGHQAGDEALRIMARLIRAGLRVGERAGRYGGEEFLLVLPGVDHAQAMRCCERIRCSVEEAGALLMNRFPGRGLTVSMGLAGTDRGPQTVSQLVKRADVALYHAKKGGRNRVVAADELLWECA